MSNVHAARQEQFLEVIDRDEARRRFHAHLKLEPLGSERVPLAATLDRVLAEDVVAQVDVPGFDRANVDGFAVQSVDTFGATEDSPRELLLNAEMLAPGVVPTDAVRTGTATLVATGAVVPRGADAVLMVEYTDVVEAGGQWSVVSGQWSGISEHSAFRIPHSAFIRITRAVSPGEHITFAGTDISRGETVLRTGQALTSREIGVLAAIGVAEVAVFRRPRVAILSTGDEIIAPGAPSRPAAVYDSNAAILAAAVRELGGEPIQLGIVADDEPLLVARVAEGLRYDLLLLSGGTSKGAGDLSYRVVSRLQNPGIVAHGVALKPGKPICLAVTNGTPVVILPGFPTSAIFTFHEFVAPVLRALGGRPAPRAEQVTATLPLRVNSERGRTEYLLVSLVRGESGLLAYPMGKGSGSVTTFSGADGFITIDQHTEMLEAGSQVAVQLLGQRLEPADLVVIGSHCVGLDYLVGQLQRRGVSVKLLNVGSMGGLAAAKRGQCDLAGIHLMDPQTGEYNRPFLTPDLELIPGYRRLQGIVFRHGDARFEGKSVEEAMTAALGEPDCTMVNRNAGSGTRILIDQLLGVQRDPPQPPLKGGSVLSPPLQGGLGGVAPQSVGVPPRAAHPPGYAVQAKSHNAVAAAVHQGRADWGVAIDTVARQYDLGFIPLKEEHYDFVAPRERAARTAIRLFGQLLEDHAIREHLVELGFRL